jgi:hypothetical protein
MSAKSSTMYPHRRMHSCKSAISLSSMVCAFQPEPFGWFAPPKFTRAWEPTLLWNNFTHQPTAIFAASLFNQDVEQYYVW